MILRASVVSLCGSALLSAATPVFAAADAGAAGTPAAAAATADAGVATAAPAPKRTLHFTGALKKEQITSVVDAQLPKVKDCYERALERNKGIGGTVAVGFTIAPNGRVSAAKVAYNDVGDAEVGTCIAKLARTWKFAKPWNGQSVAVEYPWVFTRRVEPAQPAAAAPAKPAGPALTTEQLLSVIQPNLPLLNRCYEDALAKNASLAGKFILHFKIGATGAVTEAAAKEATLPEPVQACMLEKVRTWKFPAPEGGRTVTINHPLVFEPAKTK